MTSDHRIFLQTDLASGPVPLWEIAIIGDGARAAAALSQLRELDVEINGAWARFAADRKTKEPRSGAQRVRGHENRKPDVLCAILTDNEPDHVRLTEVALSTSDLPRRLLIVGDEILIETRAKLEKCSGARFFASDSEQLLHPLRVLSCPPGLIGIDFGDFMSVWSGRWSYVCRVSVPTLIDELRRRLPFQGLALTFSGLSLAELDAVVDRVKAVVSDEVDLIWHDNPYLRSAPPDTVDVCIGYDVAGAMPCPSMR